MNNNYRLILIQNLLRGILSFLGIAFYGIPTLKTATIIEKTNKKNKLMNNYFKAGVFTGDRKYIGCWLVALFVGVISTASTASTDAFDNSTSNNIIVDGSAFADDFTEQSIATSDLEAKELNKQQNTSAITSDITCVYTSTVVNPFSTRSIVSAPAYGMYVTNNFSTSTFILYTETLSKLKVNSSLYIQLENSGSSERFQA